MDDPEADHSGVHAVLSPDKVKIPPRLMVPSKRNWTEIALESEPAKAEASPLLCEEHLSDDSSEIVLPCLPKPFQLKTREEKRLQYEEKQLSNRQPDEDCVYWSQCAVCFEVGRQCATEHGKHRPDGPDDEGIDHRPDGHVVAVACEMHDAD